LRHKKGTGMRRLSMPDNFHFKGFTISLIIALLFVAAVGCATTNGHKKIKAVSCPCETRYRR